MRVICIKQHSQGILTIGKIYEVHSTNTCRCGEIDFDIGFRHLFGIICNCGFETNGDIWWINSNKFAPLEEKGQMFIEEFIGELEPLQ